MASATAASGDKMPSDTAETEEPGKEPAQQQVSEAGSEDMSKSARPPPKVFVFASPKKGKKQDGRAVARKHSIKAKLRKALAPYLASSYLQGEFARRFTKDYLATHPVPDNEEELPEYIQVHLAELNRVTERWGGNVGRALDPLLHEAAVDERLRRQRAREEGLEVDPLPGTQQPGGRQGANPDDDDDDLDADLDLGMGLEGGLSSEQLFGAVHLVSDVKVWQQILAAQAAEERRQHAIAELHMNHAAKIIQRAWHDFSGRKQQEQARLDALVSPDVQAMLSAAAYKAMRDARNKLAIMKLRKSLSRKAPGFGSAVPRDLEPIPRSTASRKALLALQSAAQSQPASPMKRGRGTASRGGAGGSPDGGDGDDNEDDDDDDGAGSDNEASDGAVAGSRGLSAAAKYRSFAARSAKLASRLVSFRHLGGDGPEGGAAEGGGGSAGMADDAGLSGGDAELVRRQRQAARARRARRRAAAAAKQAAEGAGLEVAEGVQGLDEGEPGEHPEGGSGQSDDDEFDDTLWEGDEDEFGDDSEDDDSVCASGSEGEDEAAEAAVAEAEEVVQVAAELAKAFLGRGRRGGARGGGGGGGDSSDVGSGSEAEDDEDADRDRMGEEALQALSAVEAAAAEAERVAAGARLLAPPPLQEAAKAAAAAAAAANGGVSALGYQGPVGPGVHRGRSVDLSDDAAVIRQLIAGALAAAASPLLGRKNALAVAQMGLGELLQLPGAKGLLPKAAAAAARMRPSGGGQKGGNPLSVSGTNAVRPAAATAAAAGRGGGQHHAQPVEIRAQAAVMVGMPPGAGGGGKAGPGSEGGAAGQGTVAAAAAASHLRTAWGSGRKSIAGEIADGGAAPLGSPRRAPRLSHGGGAVTLPAVHPGVPQLGGDVAFEAAEASAAAWRHSHAAAAAATAAAFGGGAAAVGGAPGYSPRVSPTGVSASAAAALATQPWASPRRARHPPGAHTIAGALPDLRNGMFQQPSGPREPTWLLPPINRAATGPAVLGGGSGGGGGVQSGGHHGLAAAAAVAAAAAAGGGGGGGGGPGALPRTCSDPSLQRPVGGYGGGPGPSNLQGTSGGGGGGGALGQQAAGVPGALTAAAAAAVGRARRASVVGGSVDSALLQQYGGSLTSMEVGSPLVVQHSGFMINSLSTGGGGGSGGGSSSGASAVPQVVQRVRLSSLGTSESGQQPQPLPSALAGGGGGAGGGTAAARQAAAAAAQFRAG